tara:strand:+ start:155 stop:517 length:363 start_codon:yes stop_codon:yes gene_type:complete
MKHLLFTLTFLFSLSSFSQYLNGAPIEELDEEYIQIVGTERFLKPFQVTIRVMFGQVSKAKEIPLATLYTDETQKKLYPINGMVGALNFFSKYGYEYVDAYAISTQSQSVYHFLLRKRKE